MDFGETFRILLRRWRVTVPGLIITVVATVAVWAKFPVTYQSTAMLTLIGSENLSAAPGGGHNPYVSVGTLVPMANILAAELSSQQATQRLEVLGVDQSYTAQVPPGAVGPFISITAMDKSRAETIKSMPIIIAFAERQLRLLQLAASASMSKKSLIGATVIAEPSAPVAVRKSKIELDASVGIIGLVIVCLLCFSAEGRARRHGNDTRRVSQEDAVHKHRPSNKRDLPEAVWESTQTR